MKINKFYRTRIKVLSMFLVILVSGLCITAAASPQSGKKIHMMEKVQSLNGASMAMAFAPMAVVKKNEGSKNLGKTR